MDPNAPPRRAARAPALTVSGAGSYLPPLTKVSCPSRPQEQLMPDAHRDDIAKLESLYAEHPEGRIFTHLAEAYRKAGELDRAVEVLNGGLERHPEYSSAHVVRGRVLHDLGKPEEAELAFRRVLELDRHNLVALRALGDLARLDARHDQALDYYHRLLDVEPADEDVRSVIDEMTSESFADADLTWTEPSDAAFDEAFDAALDSVDQPEPRGEPEPAFQEPVWLSGETQPGEPTDTDTPEPAERPEHTGFEFTDFAEAAAETETAERAEEAEEAEEAEGTEGAEGAEAAEVAQPQEHPGYFDYTESAQQFESAEPEVPGEGEEAGASPTLAPGVMTETIAQVYARQGLYGRAAEVYRELVRGRPGDQALWDKLHEMEQLAASADMEASAEAETTESPPPPPGLETTQFRPGHVHVERLPGLESDDIDAGTGLSVDDLAAAAQEPSETLDRESALPAREEMRDDDSGWADAPWAPAPPEGFEPPQPFEPPAEPTGQEPATKEPPAEEPPADAAHADAEQEDEAGAVWLSGALAAGEPDEPTPYAWAEAEEPGDEDASKPIHMYLRSLLEWSPGTAGAGDAGVQETGAQETGAEETRAEETVEGVTEPTSESAEEDPWGSTPEWMAEPSPDVSRDSAPDATAEHGAGPDQTPEPGPEQAQEQAPEQPPEQTPEPVDDADDDDDLDTFRSWLESLKQ
jgi:tetratricopeptide (TPR) repeat protein